MYVVSPFKSQQSSEMNTTSWPVRFAIPAVIGLLVSLGVVVLLGRVSGEDEAHMHAPSFALKDTDGHIVKLDDFAGKMLAVCFVATWDAPSQKQIAILSDWLRVHDDRELAVLGLAIEQPGKQTAKTYVTQEHPDFRFLVADFQTIQAFGGLTAVPTTIVIDKDQNIIQRYVGVTEKKVLETNFKPVPPP
jgi:peroxiredoxin